MRMRQLPVTTTPARHVLFHGKPSQIINLPDFLAALLANVALIAVYYAYVSPRWNVTPVVLAAAIVLVLGRVAVAYLRTAFTEVIIDAERITRRRGILNRSVSSLELFRIQDVTSLHPWWQRPFGVGTVVVMTSDSNNPVWFLPGVPDAEQMRDDLNRAAIALRDHKGIREFNMGRV
ncbi:bacterial PH domain protein [Burkholderia pseudomallei]|nr:bacterial PH domain protein [Burkholderia pseudomallei]